MFIFSFRAFCVQLRYLHTFVAYCSKNYRCSYHIQGLSHYVAMIHIARGNPHIYILC